MSDNGSIRVARWFGTPLGAATRSAELDIIGRGIRRFHGDSMLWLSPELPESEILDRCMVRHKFYGVLANRVLKTAGLQHGCFHTGVDCLPISSGSLHGIVAHHAIDCAQDPRIAIRELSRVLAPGGRLLVVGFNPISIWYLRSLYSRLREDAFTDVNFVSPFRLEDWLKVLGFEVDDKVSYLMYRPPFEFGLLRPENWPGVKNILKNWCSPFGGVYYLLARKVSSQASMTGLLKHQQTIPGRALPQTLMNRGPDST